MLLVQTYNAIRHCILLAGTPSVTNTLNLINSTALSPWKQEDLLPWDDDYDISSRYQSVATKRSAGSLCNINSNNYHTAHECKFINSAEFDSLFSLQSCMYRALALPQPYYLLYTYMNFGFRLVHFPDVSSS